MKRITSGKYISQGYRYLNYEIRKHGYYPPDKCIWWEAVNIDTGEADYHAHSKKDIKRLIDNKNRDSLIQKIRKVKCQEI